MFTEQKFETENAKVAPFAFHWQAIDRKRRAYSIMKRVQGLDIEKLGDQNFKALLNRLKTGDESYTPEMQQFLQANKKPAALLTPGEHAFFINMLERDWVLKHVTEFVDNIKKSGTMLSLEEITRRGISISSYHTNVNEGHSDNVFFTYGPEKGLETAKFLDRVQNVITVRPKLLSRDGQKIKLQSRDRDGQSIQRNTSKALYGMWGSDHFHAYSTIQEGVSIRLGDCRYTVFYQDIGDNATGTNLVKVCQYDRADGTSVTKRVEKGQEIFTYPKIDIAILLSLIEKFRLMGLETWDLVMKMPIEEQEKIVQTFYHPGAFEVHIPRSFSLNQPGVELISRETKNDVDNSALIQFFQSIIDAAYEGRIEEVLDFCRSNQDFSKISGKLCKGAFTVTLLGAAILGGQTTLVKELLDLGINTGGNICHNNEIDKLSTLMLAFCLSSPSADWQITANKEAAFDIIQLLIKVGSVDRRNPCIRHPLPVTSKDINMGLKQFQATPEHILYLLNTLGKQLNPDDLYLELAITTDSLLLVQKMLSLGVKLNNWLESSKFSPLYIAIENGNESMVSLLLEHDNALINQEFCATPMNDNGDTIYVAPHDFEGYTPLLMAVEKGYESLVQLLVQKGASLFHQSATGKTARSIAKAKEFTSILKFLEEAIATKQEVKEAVDLQMVQQPTQGFSKIQQYYTRIILTGKEAEGERFFVYFEKIGHHFSPYGGESTFSPFVESVPTRKLNSMLSKESAYKKIIAHLNRETNLGIELENLQWVTMPAISCYISEDQTHYVDNVVFCELSAPKKIKERVSGSKHNSLKLVTASELSLDEHKKPLHIQNSWLPKITLALLTYVDKKLSHPAANLDKEEFEVLETCYQETLGKQHQLLHAAKTGDISQLSVLLDQGAVLWHRTPTLEVILNPAAPHSYPEDLRRVPFQIAWQNKQFDCALEILKNSPDMNEGRLNDFINYKIMEKIISSGWLEFYKLLHEKKLKQLNFSVDYFVSNNIFSCLESAIVAGHRSLVDYILQTMKLEEKDRLSLILRAQNNGQTNVVKILSSSVSMPVKQAELESRQLLFMKNLSKMPAALGVKTETDELSTITGVDAGAAANVDEDPAPANKEANNTVLYHTGSGT